MKPCDQLKSVLYESYTSENGESFSFGLLPPLTEGDIQKFSQPYQSLLPAEITELLQFARGVSLPEFGDILFTRAVSGNARYFFPGGVELMNDGLGNCWIADIDTMGNWGKIFYFCNEPAVLMVHANDLSQFIRQLDEYNRSGPSSTLHSIYEILSWEIWNQDSSANIAPRFERDDPALSYVGVAGRGRVIADLREAGIGQGFAWGRLTNNPASVVRHPSVHLWSMQKKLRRSFLKAWFYPQRK